MARHFRPTSRKPQRLKSAEERQDFVRRAKAQQQDNRNYRERSLELHGWICAKCGREFTLDTLHLLTVHHIDGNHDNNPADGSNWENLCIYCHDDEHSRGLLADALNRDG